MLDAFHKNPRAAIAMSVVITLMVAMSMVVVFALIKLDLSLVDIPIPETALFGLLTIKHFIADGPLQTKYQYANKGYYAHMGGLLHAAIHGMFTFAALCVWSAWMNMNAPWVAIIGASVFDFIIHYHCDWIKARTTRNMGWNSFDNVKGRDALCIYTNAFFIALMVDQMIHSLTYVVIFHWLMTATAV